MNLRNATGLVLKVGDYGESDKLITIYCPKEGKFSCIAKGAKRSLKRFMNKLEIFTLIDFQYNCRYTLPTLDRAEVHNTFTNLRGNYNRYSRATLICELLLQWGHENDGDPHLFMALTHSIRALHEGNDPNKTLVLFLIFLYSRLGYQPDFSHCKRCGELEKTGGRFFFMPELSSLYCSRCSQNSSYTVLLSLATVKLLGQAQKMPFLKTSRLLFSQESLQQCLYLYRRYGHFLLDRETLSWNSLTGHSHRS